jgi:hypothetical protein
MAALLRGVGAAGLFFSVFQIFAFVFLQASAAKTQAMRLDSGKEMAAALVGHLTLPLLT